MHFPRLAAVWPWLEVVRRIRCQSRCTVRTRTPKHAC